MKSNGNKVYFIENGNWLRLFYTYEMKMWETSINSISIGFREKHRGEVRSRIK